MVPRPPCRGTAPRSSLVREQVLDAVQLSDTPKRGRRLLDTERDTGLIGYFMGTKQCRQTRRVDKRQAAGFDGDRWRVRREGFADGCPEAGGTSHVELTDNDDGGGAVVVDLDVQGVA
jgi:hypothetical protein